MATLSSILTWRIPWTEETGGYRTWCGKESDMTKVIKHTHSFSINKNRKCICFLHLLGSYANSFCPSPTGMKSF